MHWSNIGFCIILSVLLALGKLLHRQGNKSSTPSHYSFPDVNITSDLPVAGSDSGVINSSRGKPSQREKASAEHEWNLPVCRTMGRGEKSKD